MIIWSNVFVTPPVANIDWARGLMDRKARPALRDSGMALSLRMASLERGALWRFGCAFAGVIV